MKKSFNQLDAVKKLKKEIDRSMYDGSEDIAARTRRALTIGWFWKGDMKIGTACKYLINPKRYIKERRFGGNRPNCIYVHNEYLLISDPCPDEKLGEGSGKPNNFLKEFRDKPGVLRGKQYLGTGGTKRDIYHFETTDWQTIEVFLMWLCHEVDRYIWEIPNFAAYVRKNKITNNYV